MTNEPQTLVSLVDLVGNRLELRSYPDSSTVAVFDVDTGSDLFYLSPDRLAALTVAAYAHAGRRVDVCAYDPLSREYHPVDRG